MLKKLVTISYLIIISSLLFGCTLTNKPATCDQLKRQMMYYDTSPNIEAKWTTDEQKAALRQKMAEMNCF